MTVYDVVKKLVGPIDPIGETNTDNTRFENLKALTMLVDRLVSDIDQVSTEKDRNEYSVQRAGQFAEDFLGSLEIALGECE
jgi:hypothetical protein